MSTRARLSAGTNEAMLPVGPDVGTPIVPLEGRAFSGPILDADPVDDAALPLFEALRLLAGCPDFHELKQSRTSPPDLGLRTDHQAEKWTPS